jgi:glycerol-3-phosphate dehydrogenase
MQRPTPESVSSRAYDIIVIGGGINGAAIARDAALRGFSVLLLEKDDFASGTTSWSTRLIHGGLRYLEHREFELVRESLRERERLLRNAPHLVKPLELRLPVYKHSKRNLLTIRAGMAAYDALSFDKSLPRHHIDNRTDALAAIPGLDPYELTGAAIYYDAQATFPERLVIENLLDAVSNGAVALNYARVDEIIVNAGKVQGVRWTDVLTGSNHDAWGETVINVSGPWVDRVLERGGADPGSRPVMGGTKGTHCFLPMPEPAIPPLYTEARSDGRAFFILPWNGLMMIGTTDTRYTGDLDDVVPTPDEIAYLLAEARILLPGAHIDPTQVLFSYAGVRPLPNTSAGAEAGITRKHVVVDHGPARAGLFSVVGGKLTNHRSLAEHAVDDLARYLGEHRLCETADRELPGAGACGAPAGLPSRIRERCESLYGRRAERLYGLGVADPSMLEPLVAGQSAVPAEIVLAFEEESATSLADALIRRMMVAYQPGMGRDVSVAAARFAETRFGWSPARTAAELSGYDAALTRFRPDYQ